MATWARGRSTQAGSVYAIVILAMLMLVGMAAFAMDIGRAILAAQHAQEVADAAALGAASKPINQSTSVTLARIGDTIGANNAARGPVVTWSSGEVTFYSAGQTVEGYGTLGSYEEAARVVTHVAVPYYFSKMFGIAGTTVTRRATAVRTFALGSPICPMWISYGTDYQYGQQQQLLMASAPNNANIPGNFGFLCPLTGSNDFQTLLCGYQCSPALIIGNYVTVNQIVYGQTGVTTGQWNSALNQANDGTARLQRATWSPWASDTFTSYHNDNPRILIVPMCQYLDGTGSNARFQIIRFGAFWLESVDATGSKSIVGRFIQFQTPGGSGDTLADNTGLWKAKLVK
jgi:Flp pilus assembly protein TadG